MKIQEVVKPIPPMPPEEPQRLTEQAVLGDIVLYGLDPADPDYRKIAAKIKRFEQTDPRLFHKIISLG